MACIAVFTLNPDVDLSREQIIANAGTTNPPVPEEEFTQAEKGLGKLPPPTRAEKSMMANIEDLKAYCVVAKKILHSRYSWVKSKIKNGVVELIEELGTESGKEVIREYATTIGNLKAKIAAEPGMEGYLVDSVNSHVLKGEKIINAGTSRVNKGYMLMDFKKFGLESQPKYFQALRVPFGKFLAARQALHEGTGAEARAKWINSGKADVYPRYYAEIKNKYLAKREAYFEEQKEAAEIAEHASYLQQRLNKKNDKQQVILPMPIAGRKGAESLRERVKFKFLSEKEIEAMAMKKANEYMMRLAASEKEAAIIDDIEEMLQGTTVRMTTSKKMFADSTMSPAIVIKGDLLQIDAVIDTLPLQGTSLSQTFIVPKKKRIKKSEASIGEVDYAIITTDSKQKNPWLCTKFEVQVGHGQPWVELTPNGKLNDGWWLDAEKPKAQAYYRRARSTQWLLLPKITPSKYQKRFSLKAPVCANLKCKVGTFKDLEKACDSDSECQGFTFHPGVKKGKGCLKYRCQNLDEDSSDAVKWEKGTDYWTKESFAFYQTPPDSCNNDCGFKGGTNYGKIWCGQITDQKKVDQAKCDYYIPPFGKSRMQGGILPVKPKLMKKVCPKTPRCTMWDVVPAKACDTSCGRRKHSRKENIVCKDVVKQNIIHDSKCKMHTKPKSATKVCPPTRPCVKWSVTPAKKCNTKCDTKAQVHKGMVSCVELPKPMLKCTTHVTQSNHAGVVKVHSPKGSTLTGGGMNNLYRHWNKYAAFEEMHPSGNSFHCDTAFGPGHLKCYGTFCKTYRKGYEHQAKPLQCTTNSGRFTGSGVKEVGLPPGYTMTGGGLYNHYRHWNAKAGFEESRPSGNKWRGDMGFGWGDYTVYVRGCKGVKCKTVTSGVGNFMVATCPAGTQVTGCGILNHYRRWDKLSAFEESWPSGNSCRCDGGIGSGKIQCVARCCSADVGAPSVEVVMSKKKLVSTPTSLVQLETGKKAKSSHCHYWKLKKPETPSKSCPATKPCASWKTTPPQEQPYVGCYRDNKSGKRDLPRSKGSPISYTSCRDKCAGYKYFGRQWKHQCFCGNAYGSQGKRSDCKCNASSNIGGNRNCVYRTDVSVECETHKCGVPKRTVYGQVSCQKLNGETTSDSHCHGSKPAIAKKVCAATAPCTKYVVKPAPPCPTKKCGQKEKVMTGKIECQETVSGDKVDLKKCKMHHKPDAHKRKCPATKPCAVWKTSPPQVDEYVGCYRDNTRGARDLPHQKGSNRSYATCKKLCAGYKYFGRQWNHQCFCGNYVGSQGKRSDCKCTASNIGGNRNCVYRTDTSTQCETKCGGIKGKTFYGKVFCALYGRAVRDSECKGKKPERPVKKCPTTPVCTKWKTEDATVCSKACGQSKKTHRGKVYCQETVSKRTVPDSQCKKMDKPATPTNHCKATSKCHKYQYVAERPPKCTNKCGTKAHTVKGDFQCTDAHGNPVSEKLCKGKTKPLGKQQTASCPRTADCCVLTVHPNVGRWTTCHVQVEYLTPSQTRRVGGFTLSPTCKYVTLFDNDEEEELLQTSADSESFKRRQDVTFTLSRSKLPYDLHNDVNGFKLEAKDQVHCRL
jgi:hypothetical protein